jgi:predicted histone-like DNA-binding protein
MAKLITSKYKNNNKKSTAYGKWYGRFVYTETLSTEEFAKHISSHGSPFDRATILGVLMAACDCLVELVNDSKRVRLGDLGTFYLSPETSGSETEKDFTADNVLGVHLRFWPNQSNAYPLDSTSLRKGASFVGIDQIDSSGKDSSADSAATE